MALVKWRGKNQNDPFDDFFNFDYPQMGLSLFPYFDQRVRDKNWVPAIDVSETDKEINIKADIPGIEKKDISLSAEGTILTIRGERKSEVDKKEKNYHRVERSYGLFQRSLDLGTHIDEKKVKAAYKDGVLEITVPKSEEEMNKIIQIE